MVRKITKLYVGNLPEGCQPDELRGVFEKFGKVEECDIVRNYGFVHMSSEEEAKTAIESLHNSEFRGTKITVEASHSKVRPRPGMGGKGQCYRCGRQGHWSKECPRNPNARFGNPIPPPMPPPPISYPERALGRYGPERGFGERSYIPDRGFSGDRGFAPERSFGVDRSYASDRMRPYPDPYERRPPPPPSPSPRDDYFYYRRPYDDMPFTRRSPPLPSSYASGRLTPPSGRRAPVF